MPALSIINTLYLLIPFVGSRVLTIDKVGILSEPTISQAIPILKIYLSD